MSINYEGILTTYNKDGSERASPVGFKQIENKKILITLYNSSTTLQNLKKEKECVLNIVHDPEILAGSAFNLIDFNFETAPNVNAPVLKEHNFKELKLANLNQREVHDEVGDSKAFDIELRVINNVFDGDEVESCFRSFYRGGGLLLEGAIRLSRALESVEKGRNPGRFLSESRDFISSAEDLGIQRDYLVEELKEKLENL